MSRRANAAAVAAALSAAMLLAPPARADGVTTVAQSDGSMQTYRHVRMRLVGDTLFLSSPDRRDVLEVATGACSFVGDVRRCLPVSTILHRRGRTHTIALLRGSVYLNGTDDPERLPHSSQALPPHAVLVHLHTMRGTLISTQGTLDGAR